jgi:predicted O-methyltransferase YrrM
MDLRENLSALQDDARALYMRDRASIPFLERWFYEGCWQIGGQLLSAERKFLYNWIKAIKPQLVFEIGTAGGGGSTYFIAQALWENGEGLLHTAEIDLGSFNSSVNNHKLFLGYLGAHIVFHHGDAKPCFTPIAPQIQFGDVVFFDGGNEAEATMDQYNMFLPYFKEGTYLMSHDWISGPGNDKARLLRPAVEADPKWKLIDSLSPPESVGIVLYKRIA